jgi:hypothetical protein
VEYDKDEFILILLKEINTINPREYLSLNIYLSHCFTCYQELLPRPCNANFLYMSYLYMALKDVTGFKQKTSKQAPVNTCSETDASKNIGGFAFGWILG